MTDPSPAPGGTPAPGPPPAGEIRPPSLQRRTLLGGLALLLALAVAGLALGVVGRGGLETFRSAPAPHAGWLLAAVALSAVDVISGAWRLHVLARPLAPTLRFRDCLRADLAMRCLAGLTPGQTGGGAAQLWVLHRAGLAAADGIAVATFNFLATALVLIVAAVASLMFLAERLEPWLRHSTLATAAILAVMLVGGLWLIARGAEDAAGRLPEAPDAQRIGRIRRQRRARRWGRRVSTVIRGALATARSLPRREPGAILALIPLTVLTFVAKAAYTWAVFRAFQPEGHFADMVVALVILVLALFFAPTPGAGGFAEAASTAYLVGALGAARSIGFVLWWRVLTLHLPVAIGGAVLLREIAAASRPDRPPEEAP